MVCSLAVPVVVDALVNALVNVDVAVMLGVGCSSGPYSIQFIQYSSCLALATSRIHFNHVGFIYYVHTYKVYCTALSRYSKASSATTLLTFLLLDNCCSGLHWLGDHISQLNWPLPALVCMWQHNAVVALNTTAWSARGRQCAEQLWQ